MSYHGIPWLRGGARRKMGGGPAAVPSVVFVTDQNPLNDLELKIQVNATGALNVDWGDTNNEDVTCDGTQKTLTHDYTAAGTGDYTVTITGDLDKVEKFLCEVQPIKSFDIVELNKFPALVDLRVRNDSQITGQLDQLSAITAINSQIYMYSTSISYTGPASLPAWSCHLRFQDCAWSESEVDNFLIDYDVNAVLIARTILVHGTNAAPSAASAAAITSLTNKDRTVTTS